MTLAGRSTVRGAQIGGVAVPGGRGGLTFVGFVFVLSAFVFVEPAPFDILIAACFAIFLLSGRLAWPLYVLVPALLLDLFLMGNALSVAFADNVSRAGWYAGVTAYLVLSWFLVVGLIARGGMPMVRAIFTGYTIAATISALAAIVTFFDVLPGAEVLSLYDRPRGFFKDPNVFGPFLIPIVLYSFMRFEDAPQGPGKYRWLALFALMIVGVVLSFSRAAWMSTVVALVLFVLLRGDRGGPVVAAIKRAPIVLLLGVVVLAVISTTQVASFLPQRLGAQSYDEDRFATQRRALAQALSDPAGIGPGQSERVYEYATHSLPIRVLTENGVLGFVGFAGFVVACLARALWLSLGRGGRRDPMYALFAAALVAVLFNSLVIDTLHWRHLWLLCALPWIQRDSA